jgi:hypothetical protein
MKTAVIIALIGVILGVVAASLLVPPILMWYAEPGGLPKGGQVQAVVQIPEVIRYATGRLMLGQTIGGVIGGIVGLIGGYQVSKKRPAQTLARANA